MAQILKWTSKSTKFQTELLSTDKSNQQDYCKTPKPGNAAEFQLELVSVNNKIATSAGPVISDWMSSCVKVQQHRHLQ